MEAVHLENAELNPRKLRNLRDAIRAKTVDRPCAAY